MRIIDFGNLTQLNALATPEPGSAKLPNAIDRQHSRFFEGRNQESAGSMTEVMINPVEPVP